MSPRLARILALSTAAALTVMPCASAVAQVGPSSSNIKKPAPRKPKPKAPEPSAPVVRVRTLPRASVAKRPARVRPRVARTPVKPRVATAKPPATPVKRPVAAVKPPVATVVKVKPPIRIPGPDVAEAARRAAAAEAAASMERQRVAAEQQRLAMEKVKAAAEWQAGEIEMLMLLNSAQQALTTPKTDRFRVPTLPEAPKPGVASTTYQQKVSLIFVREDGKPFDAAQVRRAPGVLNGSASGNRLELTGPRQEGAATLALGLPADWVFQNAQDAAISLRDYPGEETRTESTATAPANLRPAPLPVSAPLFASDEEREKAAAQIESLKRQPLEASAYPRPAAAALQALSRLAEARQLLDGHESLAADTPQVVRLRRWQSMEQVDRLLENARISIGEAREQLAKLGEGEAPRALVKADFKASHAGVPAMLSMAEVRAAQYAAEAEWLRAETLKPESPDRSTAVKLLRAVPEGGAQAQDVAGQLARYLAQAEAEARYRQALAAALKTPPPARTVHITRHLIRTIPVQRTVVDLLIAQSDLRPEDKVTLVGGSGSIAFQLDNGYWRARVPRTMLKGGEQLRFSRSTFTAEVEGAITIPKPDPYAPDGMLLSPPELKLISIRNVVVTAGSAGEISLFQELSPAQLKQLRLDGQETQPAKDGTWWLTSKTIPVSLRLRRLTPTANLVADEPGKKPKPVERGERIIVDGAKLEGPQAGQVAGLRVGSSIKAVETVLGLTMDRNASALFLNGGLEIVARDGVVREILIHSNITAGQ